MSASPMIVTGTATEEQDQILKFMSDPVNLQNQLVKHLESKLLGGNAVINDPNSVAMHLIEGFSCVVSDFAFAAQRASEKRLPNRAQSMSDLYLHMSDYDYVGCFATPSIVNIVMGLDKSYILNNGVLVNNTYKEIHIPAETEFTLGSIKFSLYYPIKIQVDVRTGIPLVTYDVSKQHPLMILKSNRVDFNEQKYLNYNFLMLYMSIYQFERTTKEVTLDSTIGYSETYQYSDKFYAVRLFTDYNGNRIELGQTFTQENYDPTRPTARVQVMPDTNKLAINIPQVYFTNGFMGHKLYIELYTTKGDISSNVGSLAVSQIKANFKLSKTSPNPYSECLRHAPSLLFKINSSVTTGGKDGYSYEEIRQRVINSSFRTRAQITPLDLQNYYADYGITIERYEDNLTNLLYFAHKSFVDSEGVTVKSASTYLSISPEIYKNVSTIKQNPDNSLTILPTTWFKYQSSGDMAEPVVDDDVEYLRNLSQERLCEEFNKGSYVRTPFHIRLSKTHAYPIALSYNLMSPRIEKVVMTEDNPESLAQMLIIGEDITHLEEGQRGYRLTFIVKKDMLDEVPEEAQHVWLHTVSAEGLFVGCEAVYTGTVDGNAVYRVDLATSYWIDDNGNLELTSLTDGNTTLNHKVSLETEWQVAFMCDEKYFPGVNTPNSMKMGIPSNLFGDQIVLLCQSMTIHLGHCLDDVIYNFINLTWSKEEYRRHQVDVPATWPNNTYVTDENGLPVLNEEGELQIEHNQGDPILDGQDNPIYLHRKGDLWLDTNGEPVSIQNRNNLYQIQAPVFDGRLYISEGPVQKAFVASLVNDFESYFDIIQGARGYVTERTSVYFKPARTMGIGTFQVGNGLTTNMELDMSLEFKIYVDPVVNTDASIMAAVTATIIDIVEPMLQNEVISQSAMADAIKEKISYVHSVDCLGINGRTSLQTLTLVSTGVKPSLKRKLAISEDNQIVMVEDIILTYVDAY